MPLSITPAAPPDIPALIELLEILFSLEQDFQPDADKQRRGLEMLLARPDNGVILLARHATAGVVGMVSAQLVISTASGAPSAWVEDVVIRPEFRAGGLGRRLLDAVSEWAVAHGARRLQLLADADNAPALGFYRHLDWQATRLFAWRKFPS
ncbi:N-acetyltransferase [Betaproteobacteria bacterium]|nr:N-acetyltransferase [Betaproteobacteria bacterium]GHU16466.1 N-acetyltransferase [Betaproteobacteria bacterium]